MIFFLWIKNHSVPPEDLDMLAKKEQPNAYYGYSLTQMLPNELKYPKLPYPQRNYKMIHITNKSVEENFQIGV